MKSTSPIALFRLVIGFLVYLAWILPGAATAQDCGCSATCGSTYGQSYCSGGSYSSCSTQCRINRNTALAMDHMQQMIDHDYPAVIDAYKKALDRLWDTKPGTPEFSKAFAAYQEQRKRKDEYLYFSYTTLGLVGLLTMGKAYAVQDEKWMVPMDARPAFHEYAVELTGQLVNVGPDLMDGKLSNPQRGHNELVFAKGTYSRYAKKADEANLKVLTDKYGMPPIHLGMGLTPMMPDPDRPAAAPSPPQTPEEKAASMERGRERRAASHARATATASTSSQSPEERAAVRECTDVTSQAVQKAAQQRKSVDVLAAISRTTMRQCMSSKGFS